MAYELPDKLKKLVPYEPMKGTFHLRLDANESFLEPPADLRTKIAETVAALPFNRYPDPCCTKLCKGFGAFFGVDPDLVVAGNGSDELIGLIASSFLNAGESMVVVEPDFSMYAFYAQFIGAQVETFKKDPQSFNLDAEALIRFVKEKKARLLIFSNPCNPTSLKASQKEMLKIAHSLDCLVVADEAYMDFSDGSILQAVTECDNLIVLKTCSKAFGMAGIRLGFAVAGSIVSRALRAAKSPYNVNCMTQAVGELIFSETSYIQNCITQIKRSRDGLYQALLELSQRKKSLGTPVDTCANFVFLPVSNASALHAALAERGAAVRLIGGYLRISAGEEAENQELIQLLDELTE